MDRKLVRYVALGGMILAAVALLLLELPLGLGNGSNAPAPGGASPGGLLIYVLGICGSVPLVLAALVLALIQTAQRKRWKWFGILLGEGILALVLSSVISFYAPWAFLVVPLTLILYGVVGPATPAIKRD